MTVNVEEAGITWAADSLTVNGNTPNASARNPSLASGAA